MLREFALGAIALASIACRHDLRSLYGDGSADARGADANDLGVTDDVPTRGDAGAVRAAQIVAGEAFTCARMTDGTVRCWGAHESGQVGIGPVVFTDGGMGVNVPTEVVGLSSVTGLALGTAHACAIAGGVARCWGSTSANEIDDGPATSHDVPAPFALGVPAGAVVETSGGSGHTCARTADGFVRCRGPNLVGELGAGRAGFISPLPAFIRTLAPHEQIVSGRYHNCVLMTDHTVQCWGWNEYGQLGYDAALDCRTVEDAGMISCGVSPAPVPMLSTVARLAAGQLHTCALMADATVQCWGSNQTSQLGYASTVSCPIAGGSAALCTQTPTAVTGLSDVIQISAGANHTCAVLSNHTVRCWGANDYSQLGIDTVLPRCMTASGDVPCTMVPMPVPALTDVVEVACGGSHTCARVQNGTVLCWGLNNAGQLGTGDFVSSPNSREVLF